MGPIPAELFSINVNYWVLQTIAMLLTALLIPGLQIKGPIPAILTVIALAFINSKVWDAALFLSLPDHISVQAGLLIITNGLVFWVVAKLLPGIDIEGIFPALVAPLVFSISSLLISQYGKDVDWIKVGQNTVAQIQSWRSQFTATASENNLNSNNSAMPDNSNN